MTFIEFPEIRCGQCVSNPLCWASIPPGPVPDSHAVASAPPAACDTGATETRPETSRRQAVQEEIDAVIGVHQKEADHPAGEGPLITSAMASNECSVIASRSLTRYPNRTPRIEPRPYD